jgi:hypothetical protein
LDFQGGGFLIFCGFDRILGDQGLNLMILTDLIFGSKRSRGETRNPLWNKKQWRRVWNHTNRVISSL